MPVHTLAAAAATGEAVSSADVASLPREHSDAGTPRSRLVYLTVASAVNLHHRRTSAKCQLELAKRPAGRPRRGGWQYDPLARGRIYDSRALQCDS